MNETALQQKLAAMFSANDDKVTIPKIYVDMTDDLEAAAVLDEIMFWTLPKKNGKTSLRVFRDGHLWLAVRRTEWWDRKRLTERQADTAIEKLIKMELVEKDRFLFDGKPTVHLRLKMEKFVVLYTDKIKKSIDQDDENLVRDIGDLYEMMGFPIHESVNCNSRNGEMLNSRNGEFINNLQQSPNNNLANSPLGISNKIYADQPVTEEDVQSDRGKNEAPRMFEKAFGTGTWPWSSNNVWIKFEKFICQIHAKDPTAFGKYTIWRATDGKYTAMNNKQIRTNPQVFMDTGWAEFEKSLGEPSKQNNGRSSERLNRD